VRDGKHGGELRAVAQRHDDSRHAARNCGNAARACARSDTTSASPSRGGEDPNGRRNDRPARAALLQRSAATHAGRSGRRVPPCALGRSSGCSHKGRGMPNQQTVGQIFFVGTRKKTSARRRFEFIAGRFLATKSRNGRGIPRQKRVGQFFCGHNCCGAAKPLSTSPGNKVG